MASRSAWILFTQGGCPVCVSDREMIEYELNLLSYPVPLSPHYCSSVTLWRDKLIPLMHLSQIFNRFPLPPTREVGIVAYQVKPKTPLQHIALALDSPPLRVMVDDDMAHPAVEPYTGVFAGLAKAFFRYENDGIPILNIAHLGSEAFRHLVEKSPRQIERV